MMSRISSMFLLAAVLVATMLATGCSRDEGLRCESNERYASSRTMPPLQVPEGLTVPDETDVLRIPDVSEPEPDDGDLGCIESPPPFDGGASGQ